jgi:uncharacterized LabA/DUF88 family protein
LHKNTFVYIDGFNFYYGAVKNSPYKWLDLVKLSKLLMAGDDVLKVKYFTAKVRPMNDPMRPRRQEVYWRALKTLYSDEIEIIKGHFRTDPKKFPKAIRDKKGKFQSSLKLVWVMKTEEKGSDVNLAVHLVNDAWNNCYDQALVISNDTDLAESIRIVKNDLGKEIFLANPFYRIKRRSAQFLRALKVQTRNIREKQLKTCQLPDQIPGTKIHKPNTW